MLFPFSSLSPNFNIRYAALSGGDSCYCFGEMPQEALTPLPDSYCEKPCTGDQNQFCGGDEADILQFYVATCIAGEYRFGDSCFRPVTLNEDILTNADACYLEGMELFWPDTKEELNFATAANHLFSGQPGKIHVGFRSMSATHGILNADYSVGVGIPFVTAHANGAQKLSPSNPMDLLNKDECLIYDVADGQVKVETPCEKHLAVCKQKLGETITNKQ